jgi:hypothetical protein
MTVRDNSAGEMPKPWGAAAAAPDAGAAATATTATSTSPRVTA